MSDSRQCPQCGSALPSDAPAGLCARCLLQLGFESHPGPASNPSAGSTSYQPRFVPPTAVELAARFPQLEIQEEIGHGGMGVVYKARQKDLDRTVALKILRPDIEHDPAFAERFVREARALARLSHSAIVTVFDFGRSDGLFYFIMEYVDGANLRQLERTGKLTPAEALRIVPAICEALQYAHDQGVVHRDIKPENILIGTDGRVKIADFGLAKIVGTAPDATSLTGAWQVMGTPHYMAPEQMQGAHAVDHRADIYSLGVVIYEMLTGELPMGRFPLPSQRVQVDVRLDEIVLRALEREPDRRYQHATDVKTEIESISREAAPTSATSTMAARRAAVAEELKPACIGLRITGLLEFALGLVPIAIAVLDSRWNIGPTELFILFGPSLIFGALAVVTASILSRQRNYAAALYGCIFCTLPLSGGWFLRVVFAVLALVSLRRANVKTAFSTRESHGTKAAADASASIPPAGWYYGLWRTHEPGYANWVRGRLLLWFPIWLVAAAVALVLGAVSGKLSEPLFGMVIGAAVVLFPLWLLLRKQEQVGGTNGRADSDSPTLPDESGGVAGDHGVGRDLPVLAVVGGPATALIVVGIVEWIACWLSCLVFAVIALGGRHDLPAVFPDRETLRFLLPAVAVLGAVLSSVVILAGLKMRRLESRTFVIAGSILTMLISPGNVIGLPIGLWSLYTLSRRDVKDAFHQRTGSTATPVAQQSEASA